VGLDFGEVPVEGTVEPDRPLPLPLLDRDGLGVEGLLGFATLLLSSKDTSSPAANPWVTSTKK